MGRPAAETCLGCSKKFTSKEASVQCTVCGLWIHKVCAGLTDELFDFLDKQFSATGTAYWACKPCTVYAQGMNHRLRGIESDLAAVKKVAAENTSGLHKVEEKVNELSREVQQKNNNIVTREEFEAYKKEVSNESKERKARELNVVIHGLGEHKDERAEGKERWDWDVKSCTELFREFSLQLTAESIKFCRRVGERGGGE